MQLEILKEEIKKIIDEKNLKSDIIKKPTDDCLNKIQDEKREEYFLKLIKKILLKNDFKAIRFAENACLINPELWDKFVNILIEKINETEVINMFVKNAGKVGEYLDEFANSLKEIAKKNKKIAKIFAEKIGEWMKGIPEENRKQFFSIISEIVKENINKALFFAEYANTIKPEYWDNIKEIIKAINQQLPYFIKKIKEWMKRIPETYKVQYLNVIRIIAERNEKAAIKYAEDNAKAYSTKN